MTKIRIGVAALLAGATALLGLGCTPPSSDWEEQQRAQWIGNGIFALIYIAMCQANHGVCPFPLGPTQPAPVVSDATLSGLSG